MTDSYPPPLIGIIMGSQSDWDTMRETHELLHALDIPHEYRIVSAHRTPERMREYAKTAKERGLKVIIAGAGGAAQFAWHGCQYDLSTGAWRSCRKQSA